MKDLKKLWACLTTAILTCSFVFFGGACEFDFSFQPSNPQNEPTKPGDPAETNAGFEVYSGVDLNDKPIANDYTATLTSEGEIAKVTLTGVNATKELETSEYTIENNELTIYGEAFGSTVYGDVAIRVDFENGKTATLQEEVVTKYFSSAEDLNNMIWYGGYAGFNEYNQYIGKEKTYAYDGYFVLSNNINAYGNPYAERTYYWYHPNNEWNASYPYEMGSQGFRGIFDGAGYTIYNYSAGGKFSGGLFGGVSKRAVIKNLGLEAKLSVGLESDGTNLVSVFAFNFSGTMQNCYIDVTVDESSPSTANGYFPIGIHLALSRFKDVVVRFDTENVPMQVERIGVLGGTLSRSHAWTNPATFDNLHVIVLENYSSDYQLGSWYGEAEQISKAGFTMHDFYAESDMAITMTDSTYWDFSGTHPIFKSAK